jgi:hypothetical protein
MKKIILVALVLVAFIAFSFRMIGSNKQSTKNETSSAQASGGFASSDPIN